MSTATLPSAESSLMRPALRIVVVGYSIVGTVCAQGWSTAPRYFELGARAVLRIACSRNVQATTEFSDRFGFERLAIDWREGIASEDVDIVRICTPGHLHAEIALAAPAAGKHVLCEKALAGPIEKAAVEGGFRRILVTEPEHPYAGAWWSAEHGLGYHHDFVRGIADFIRGIVDGVAARPSFDDGLQTQRILGAAEASALADARSPLVSPDPAKTFSLSAPCTHRTQAKEPFDDHRMHHFQRPPRAPGTIDDDARDPRNRPVCTHLLQRRNHDAGWRNRREPLHPRLLQQ